MSDAKTLTPKQGAVIGGWVCLALGTAFMLFSLISFYLSFFLFFASFVLSIVAIAQRHILNGIAILLLSVLMPLCVFAYEAHQTIETIEKPSYSSTAPYSTSSRNSGVQEIPKSDLGSSEITKQLPEAEKPSTRDSLSLGGSDNYYGYDIKAYCQKVSQTIGGSYMIEESCRRHEYEARNKINNMSVPLEIKNYCKQMGDTVGGSYQVTESCIRHEIEAKRTLELEAGPRNKPNGQRPNSAGSPIGDPITTLDSTGLTKRYKNERFGFSMDYPQTFIAKEPPQNGDGIKLTSPDGEAILIVSGGNNAAGFTTKQYYEAFIEELNSRLVSRNSGLAYRKLADNWFVITWRDRDKLGYMKMFVGSGSQNSFVFIYPVAQKISFDEVVTKMEKSFRSGKISQTW